MQTSVLYSKSQHSRGTSKDPDECDESAPGASAGLKHKCCLLKGWVIKRQDKRKLWRMRVGGGGVVAGPDVHLAGGVVMCRRFGVRLMNTPA